jgi:hypothetical protein
MISSDFWYKLRQDSKGFSSPVVGQNLHSFPINKQTVSNLFYDIYSDIDGSKYDYIRFYIDGAENQDACKLFFDHYNNTADIDKVLNEYGRERSFGIVINGALRWKPELVEQLAEFLRPIYNQFDKHEIGFDLTFFIGNYGYTPFGVHLDDKNHRTLLVNLGPNEKQMMLWEQSKIKDLYGDVSNIYDVDSLSIPPTRYKLNPSDYFLLPSQYYHVGYTKDISITAALILHREDHVKHISKELDRYLREILNFELDFDSPTLSNDWLSCVPQPCFLQHCVEARRKSNGGFMYSPQKRAISFDMLSRSNALVRRSFPICYVEQDPENIFIFAKGLSKQFNQVDNVKNLIDKLNQENFVEIQEVFKNLDKNELNKNNILKIIMFLYQSFAIDLK